MSRVPGLFMQNRYNFAQDLRLSIRGFGARAQFGIRGIKVLVDGIPETLPDGQGSVDSIDLGATSQIEVIRGPSSSLYGNASGGVISLSSEGGRAEPYAQVRVAAGGYGFEKTQFKTGGETERLNYLVSVSDQKIDGYRAQSAYENKQLTGRFDSRSRQRTQPADRPQLHGPTGVRRRRRAHARGRAREPALGGSQQCAVRRRRVARADTARLRLFGTHRRARHDHRPQLLRVARLRQPVARRRQPASSISIGNSSAAVSTTATMVSGSIARTASSPAWTSTTRTTTAAATTI